MFEPFSLQQATRISFGADRLRQLGEDVLGVAGPHVRVMVLSDRGVVAAGLVDRALAALAERGLSTTVFAELEGEPHAELIDRAAAAARSSGAGVVVALGGGSALDVGKMTAAIAPARAAAEDFALCARPMPAGGLPIVCVPTTAGTGAEVTTTAVFADGNGRKTWAWDEALRPRLALLDPTLTTSLPRALTAITGLDALVHAIEAASSRRATPFSDAYALHAIRLIARNLERAVGRPEDLESRAGMLLGACLAGRAIDIAGTGAAHALGHALANVITLPHGRAVALALRVVLPWHLAGAPERYSKVAAAMEMQPTMLAARYDQLVRSLGLEVDLTRDGLGVDDADRITEIALAPENRPMLEANARTVDAGAARRLVDAMLAARQAIAWSAADPHPAGSRCGAAPERRSGSP